MRIACSGTLYSGKTALIGSLSGHLPTYRVFDEPYLLMIEEGHHFSDPPTPDEYDEQMERLFRIIAQSPADALIDRCPLDCLAFAEVASGRFGFALDPTRESDLRDALARLDLIVLVPLESPDRIDLPRMEDAGLRTAVDEKIRDLVFDGSVELPEGTEVVEVNGSVDDRVRTVLRHVR